LRSVTQLIALQEPEYEAKGSPVSAWRLCPFSTGILEQGPAANLCDSLFTVQLQHTASLLLGPWVDGLPAPGPIRRWAVYMQCQYWLISSLCQHVLRV
jgi:hypothetical protein